MATGPKKNIAHMFKDATLSQGLRFGVSQHLHASYEWMATAFGSDKTGPLAGVPYDGNDPRYAEALAIIRSGQESLKKNPNPDADGFVAFFGTASSCELGAFESIVSTAFCFGRGFFGLN